MLASLSSLLISGCSVAASGILVAAFGIWECSVAASGLATVLADPSIADDVALGNDHGHCSGS